MQGRVTSIGRLMSFAACAAGPALGGILTHRYGAAGAVPLLFAGVTVMAGASFLAPSMRDGNSAKRALPGETEMSVSRP
jgi:hypothetical protein